MKTDLAGRTNFIGLMDDFRVYDIALSQTEINQLYGNGSGDVALVPVISTDPVMKELLVRVLSFTRGGKPFPASEINSSPLP